LTNHVNGDPPLLPQLFEQGLRRLRTGLYELSDTRFPGLRARHYRLLSFISDDGVRLSRVAEASGLTKQALAQALTPLEAGGYVDVVPDPTDRRARVVRRSDRGRDAVAAVRAMEAAYEREWSERVGAERWATVRTVLTELFTPSPAADAQDRGNGW
jgi:DNA-binding MarR family transcriptional regulator